MNASDLSGDILIDLLRSGSIVENARSHVYAGWARDHERFTASHERARARAALLASTLEDRAGRDDESLAIEHARWMQACVPHPDEAFADLFLARLAGWVDAHIAPFLEEEDSKLMLELGHKEIEALEWKSELPVPPPFEPLASEIPARSRDVRVRIGVLGDLHVGSKNAEALGEAAIQALNSGDVDVAVQLGDLTDHGERDEFERASSLLQRLDMPWVTMIGNHDAYSTSEERLSGREYFEDHFCRPPDGALIEHNGVKLAILDSVEHGISPFPPYDLVSGTFNEGNGGAIVRGALSSPQHDILAEVAGPGGGPAFVFLHHPPQPFVGFPPVIFGLRDADSGRLHATCDSGNVWGVFAGHTHRNKRGRALGAAHVQEVAASRDFPFGYAVIDVRADGYTYRFLQIPDESLIGPLTEGLGAIQRRYSLGEPSERAFDWRSP